MSKPNILCGKLLIYRGKTKKPHQFMCDLKVLVGRQGLEPRTSSTSRTRSSQLSYRPTLFRSLFGVLPKSPDIVTDRVGCLQANSEWYILFIAMKENNDLWSCVWRSPNTLKSGIIVIAKVEPPLFKQRPEARTLTKA